ncbi:MAG: hypothetical protein IT384_28525, partial [Deltaproteobacteria bacterium]|nr:hypothetical protein [Deltaproteobacteria bacterium]
TQVSAWDLVAEVEIRVAILEETTTRKAFDQVAGTQLRRSIGEVLLELKRVVGAVPPKTSGKKSKYAIVPGPVADVAGAMAAVLSGLGWPPAPRVRRRSSSSGASP